MRTETLIDIVATLEDLAMAVLIFSVLTLLYSTGVLIAEAKARRLAKKQDKRPKVSYIRQNHRGALRR